MFAAVEGGGGNRGGGDGKNTGSCFQHVEANLRFKLVDPGPTHHVTVPLSTRSTRLRSPIYLSDTLPLCRRWFRHLVSKRA